MGAVRGSPSIRDLLIRRLASLHIKGVVAFVDGLRRLRWFSSLRAAPVSWSSIQNLHLVGDDLGCGAFLAFRAVPLPSLQPAFQVNMPALIQVFSADLSQPAEADDLKPLHPLAETTGSVFPPFVNRKAESTDGRALRAEFKLWGFPQQTPPELSYSHIGT